MDYSLMFRLTQKGLYRCPCQACFDTLDNAMYHLDKDGYCENGIRMYDVNRYECKCGVTDMCRADIEFTHYYENKGQCIRKRENVILTHCDTCNKDFYNISWYERHCETKKHKERSQSIPIYDLECKVCNIKCLSQQQIRKHLETSKHKKLVESHCVILVLYCNTCDVKCRGQKEMKKHLETKKHIKNECNLTNKSRQPNVIS